jgi:hypothetical protein
LLLDKYLPDYHYSEKHEIGINAPAEKIYELVHNLDVSESRIIKILFALRGLPSRMLNKESMQKTRFIELERIENTEMIIGLIGQFWKPNGNLQEFEPSEFLNFNKTDFLKSVWNFHLIQKSPTVTVLSTETRIQCLGPYSKRRFSGYWFLIRPFSGLIRKEMLRAIKKKSERLHNAETNS